MTDATLAPTLNPESMKAIGQRLSNLFDKYSKDRKPAEERWLKNLRQFRGIYDKDVMIPKNRSRAYPKLTRWAVVGTVAKLMQMLFPQTEKNWGIAPSPLPDLETNELQSVLDQLSAANPGGQLTNDVIEKAISQAAQKSCDRMEKLMDDQLQEIDYVRLARRVVFSGVLYNIGVLKGPFANPAKSRTWEQSPGTGAYKAVEKTIYKPLYENTPVWSYYPDMSAQSLEALDGEFERHVMIRPQIEALAKRSDFLGDNIKQWLKDNTSGNFKSLWWEEEMRSEKKSDRSDTNTHDGRKYTVISYSGAMQGKELADCGVRVADKDLGMSFQANVWMIEQTIIKAVLMPLGDDVAMYHKFLFEEDDLSLLGNGLPDTLRDSQLSICESVRMALDNASIATGQNLEVNVDLLAPGQDTSIQAFKVWLREGTGSDAQIPAVRRIELDSHLNELTGLVNLFLAFSERESGLPPASMGDVTQGGSEALRTSQNASIFLGQAALPIRDTVRNFDVFTISVMTSLYKFNMKFDADPTRKGDNNIIARGSTSLIAKEVLANSLDQFRATISPDEQPHIKTRALLVERMKTRDLPIDEILEDEDVAAANIKAQQDAAAAAGAAQDALVQAQIKELLTNAMKNAASAKKMGDDGAVAVYEAVMKVLNDAAATKVAAARPKPKATA